MMKKKIYILWTLLIIIFGIVIVSLNYMSNYLLSFISFKQNSAATMDTRRSSNDKSILLGNSTYEQTGPIESDNDSPLATNIGQMRGKQENNNPTNQIQPNQSSQPELNQVPKRTAESTKISAKPTQEKLTYSPDISTEKQGKVQENISIQDKANVASILLKKLSPSDLSLFMKMASGGLSVEEKREAKKIFLQKLTEDEYNQLIAIAAKYGLSEGKNYQESLKEKLDVPKK